jgi:hypothetical protein
MKQATEDWRLTRMHASMHQVVASAVRTAAMVVLAMFLILRLFPAVLEAGAGRN